MSISERVLQIIKENLSEEKNINAEDLLQDLEISSIIFIQIIVALENEFNFEFEDEKLLFTEFPAAKDMIDYVISRTDGKNNDC